MREAAALIASAFPFPSALALTRGVINDSPRPFPL